MIFRGVGTSLVALGYLAVVSEAGLCRLSTTSLSVSDSEPTSSTTAPVSTSSLTSTTLPEPETTTILSDSSTSEITSSIATPTSTDDVRPTIIVPTETTLPVIIDTTTIMTPDVTSDLTSSTTDPASSTTEVISEVVTSEIASSTTSPAAVPTLLMNLGFDDLELGTQPWSLGGSNSNNDQTFYHDGVASLKISMGSGDRGQWRQISQTMNTAALEANVEYTYSFRFYSQAPGPMGACQTVYMAYYYGAADAYTSVGYTQLPLNNDYNTWYLASTTCTLSQAQIDAGNARIAIGYYVGYVGGDTCWLDTVKFEKSQAGQ